MPKAGQGGKSQGGFTPKHCTFCQKRGHTQPECFADPSSPKYKGPKPKAEPNVAPVQGTHERGNVGLATGLGLLAEGLHSEIHPLYRAHCGDAYVTGNESKLKFPVKYLRDTGATLSILCSGVIPKPHRVNDTVGRVAIRGINYLSGTYPLIETQVVCDLYKGPVTVAVVDHVPISGVGLILGNEIFASQEDPELAITCGVVTRAQAQKDQSVTPSLEGFWDEPQRESGEISGECPPTDEEVEGGSTGSPETLSEPGGILGKPNPPLSGVRRDQACLALKL